MMRVKSYRVKFQIQMLLQLTPFGCRLSCMSRRILMMLVSVVDRIELTAVRSSSCFLFFSDLMTFHSVFCTGVLSRLPYPNRRPEFNRTIVRAWSF